METPLPTAEHWEVGARHPREGRQRHIGGAHCCRVDTTQPIWLPPGTSGGKIWVGMAASAMETFYFRPRRGLGPARLISIRTITWPRNAYRQSFRQSATRSLNSPPSPGSEFSLFPGRYRSAVILHWIADQRRG